MKMEDIGGIFALITLVTIVVCEIVALWITFSPQK